MDVMTKIINRKSENVIDLVDKFCLFLQIAVINIL
jgi:hypothetical protein